MSRVLLMFNMGVNNHTIPSGVGNTCIIKDHGVIMIDSGEPKKEKVFFDGLKAVSIKPEEIQIMTVYPAHG